VYQVWVNPEQVDLDALVNTFASEWLRLGDSQLATEIVADPVLVLGPEGTAPVPRSAFLAAVTSRSKTVKDSADSITTLANASAQSLGDRMVLATISWSFSSGDTPTTLVSDFLLQREGPHPLRCVAYLPRTNVLDHLE
jgi:hypothetical protein